MADSTDNSGVHTHNGFTIVCDNCGASKTKLHLLTAQGGKVITRVFVACKRCNNTVMVFNRGKVGEV